MIFTEHERAQINAMPEGSYRTECDVHVVNELQEMGWYVTHYAIAGDDGLYERFLMRKIKQQKDGAKAAPKREAKEAPRPAFRRGGG